MKALQKSVGLFLCKGMSFSVIFSENRSMHRVVNYMLHSHFVFFTWVYPGLAT